MTSCREADKTNLLIAAQKQKVVKKETATEMKRAVIDHITLIHIIHKHTHICMDTHTHTRAQIAYTPLMHSTHYTHETI